MFLSHTMFLPNYKFQNHISNIKSGIYDQTSMHYPTSVNHRFSLKKQHIHSRMKISAPYPTEKISTFHFSDGKPDRHTYRKTGYDI